MYNFAVNNPGFVIGRIGIGALISAGSGGSFGIPLGLIAAVGGMMATSDLVVNNPEAFATTLIGVLSGGCPP